MSTEGSNGIRYTVACTFVDANVARDWLAWLENGHLADVCACGAVSAEAVQMDGPGITYEARYLFPSREAFDGYERDHAPRLRAEGLEKFPLDLGLSYRRSVGESVFTVRT